MKHILLVVLGLTLSIPALADFSTEPKIPASSEATASKTDDVVAQVPESLKRKVKPSTIVKKPVVAK